MISTSKHGWGNLTEQGPSENTLKARARGKECEMCDEKVDETALVNGHFVDPSHPTCVRRAERSREE